VILFSDLLWAINNSLEEGSTGEGIFFTNIGIIATYIDLAILSHENSPFEVCPEYMRELKWFLNNFDDNLYTPTAVDEPVLRFCLTKHGLVRIHAWILKAVEEEKEETECWEEDYDTFIGERKNFDKQYTLVELVTALMTKADPVFEKLKPWLSYISHCSDDEEFDNNYDSWLASKSKLKDPIDCDKFAGFEAMQTAMSKQMATYIKSGKSGAKSDKNSAVDVRLMNLASFGLCIANFATFECAKQHVAKDEPSIKLETTPVEDYFPKALKAITAPQSADMEKDIGKDSAFKSATPYDRSKTYTAFLRNRNAAFSMRSLFLDFLRNNKNGMVDVMGVDDDANVPDPSRVLQHYSYWGKLYKDTDDMKRFHHVLDPYSRMAKDRQKEIEKENAARKAVARADDKEGESTDTDSVNHRSKRSREESKSGETNRKRRKSSSSSEEDEDEALNVCTV
jgi:hypothetical protein